MGVDFVGETRRDSQVYIVDAYVKGMPDERVSGQATSKLRIQLMAPTQSFFLFGDQTKEA